MRTVGIVLSVPLGIAAALFLLGYALGRRTLNREWVTGQGEDKYPPVCAICYGSHRTLDHLYERPEPS
jgi:hypothetical protein